MSESVSLKQISEEVQKNVKNWPEWKQRAYACYWHEESERGATSESPKAQEAARKQAADK
jgi:hypothetical protein